MAARGAINPAVPGNTEMHGGGASEGKLPCVLIACACVATGFALVWRGGSPTFEFADFSWGPPWRRTVENMTYRRTKRSRHADTLEHIDMPRRDRMVHFVAADSATCTDLLDDADTRPFAVSAQSKPAFPRWTGPSAKSVLPTAADAPGVSIFVTLDGSSDAAALVADGDRASLFLAYATDPPSSARGDVAEKWVQLSVHGADDGGHELRAMYGDDLVVVRFPPLSHPRTCYLVRDARTLRVGYFDPNGRADDTASVDARQGHLLPSEAPVRVNATGAQIGGIVSVVVYADAVFDVLDAVRAGIARHALLGNTHYRSVRESLTSLRDEISAQKQQPRYAGKAVASVCADITNRTTFDPVLASAACRDAIRESCEVDPSQRHCECWDDSFEQRDSAECVAQRTVFGSEPAAAATNHAPPQDDRERAGPGAVPTGKLWLRRSLLGSLFRPT